MKKQIFSKMALTMALMAVLTACSNEDNVENTASKQKMVINVEEAQSFQATDGITQTGGMTRALPAEYEGSDNIKRGTTFEMGDAIGIFEVSGGTITAANVPYYFSGQVWDSSSSISFDAGKKYFAYFPYKEGVTAADVVASATTAEDFFSSVISGWTVADDQSSYDNYKASDLMVGAGTISVDGGGNTVMNFQMTHQMGLVVLNLGQVKHMLRSGTYYWFDEVNKKCKGTTGNDIYYKPSYILEEYRAIVPLNTNVKFCATDDEWAVNAYITQKGHYQLYDIGSTEDDPNAGIQYFDLQLGDIYYKDGSLMHVTADNNDARMARSADAEGFVVFVSDGSAEDQKVIDPSLDENGMLARQYSHALVMRIDVNKIAAGTINDFRINGNIGSVTQAYRAAGHSVKIYYSVAAAVNDYDGLVSTTQVVGSGNSTYDAWYTAAHPGPSTFNVHNSGWFIPGMGQLVHSLLRTGAISQETYNSMLQDTGIRTRYSVNPTIWQNYMFNAVGSTSLEDRDTFTDSDYSHGLMTSTFYPQPETGGSYVNWFFMFNFTNAWLTSQWNGSSSNTSLPSYAPMMLAF